jgi:predicted GTPase
VKIQHSIREACEKKLKKTQAVLFLANHKSTMSKSDPNIAIDNHLDFAKYVDKYL